MAVPRFPLPLYWDWLSRCYGYEPKWGRGLGFSQQLSSWTVAISLRAVAQKLQ
jgi:hypothetical protein